MNNKVLLKYSACIIFITTCLLTVIDTHLFVYQSLSRYLLLETGIMTMSLLCLLAYIANKQKIIIGPCEWLTFAWIIYIVLHGRFIASTCELYRTYYLCTTLALIVVLTGLQRIRLLSRENIETCLLAVAIIHIVYITCQWMGMTDSGNKYFDITGCNENPTVTALYLVGCMPLLASRIRLSKERSGLYFVLFVISVICILTLRCRTAYIGLGIEVGVMLTMTFKSRQSVKNKPIFYVFISGILLFMAVSGLKMYNMKKDSADGRRLIWKLSAEMIAEKPSGHGYGLFEKNYNLHQAGYFANRKYSGTEKHNADFVYVPYNDYLEHGVEGGVAGMLFLAAFYALMTRKAVSAGDKDSVAVFAAFAVMSLTNFVYTSIQPWLLVMCYSSFVAYNGNEPEPQRKLPYLSNTVLLLVTVTVAYKVCCFTKSQMMLKKTERLADGRCFAADGEYEELENKIGTSEAFWSLRAGNGIRAKRYEEALTYVRKARAYSSHPELFAMQYRCLEHLGDTSGAVGSLDTLSYMLPQKLSVKYMLMKHYAHAGHNGKALYYADDILSTGTKVESDEATMIINKAKQFKESHE